MNMPPKNKRLVVCGFLFLFIFITFAIVEALGAFLKVDPILTNNLQKVIPRNLDEPLSFFSVLGSIEVVTLVLIIFGLTILKKERLIPFSLCIFGLIMIVELLGKFYIYHPGPPKELLRYSLPFATPHYIGAPFSFPSGHTARTTFLAVVAAVLSYKYIKDKKLKIAAIVGITFFVIGMAISRIYLGEHWTSDVIGGLLLGGSFGFLAMVYY